MLGVRLCVHTAAIQPKLRQSMPWQAKTTSYIGSSLHPTHLCPHLPLKMLTLENEMPPVKTCTAHSNALFTLVREAHAMMDETQCMMQDSLCAKLQGHCIFHLPSMYRCRLWMRLQQNCAAQ